MISMNDFGAEEFWDKRYETIEREVVTNNGEDTDSTYDWYMDFHDLAPYFAPFLMTNNKNMEIFIPGCGNSSMGYELYKLGFHNGNYHFSIDLTVIPSYTNPVATLCYCY